MGRINLIRGIHYALWGYYPELKIDRLRRCFTGLGGRDIRYWSN